MQEAIREVTVVIPNYNGEKYLVPCLRALYGNTAVPMDVLVVDNGSEDGSIAEAKERFPEAEYVLFDRNYGFCRAVNEGIRRAKTEYVLLLNNDTEIRRGFVEHLLRTVKKSPEIFSVEAKMLQYGNHELIDSAGTYYNALGWAFARGRDASAAKYCRRSRSFAACAGAAIYRRAVFEEIGYFDEKHFAYLEDIDIGYRARICGYVNLYEPKAQVIHVGSAASGSRYNEFKTRYSARNNIYLIYKNMPTAQILLNFPLLAAGLLAKALFFWKKGLGPVYLKSLKDGFSLCLKGRKVPYNRAHLKNYVQIQAELWINIIRRFL